MFRDKTLRAFARNERELLLFHHSQKLFLIHPYGRNTQMKANTKRKKGKRKEGKAGQEYQVLIEATTNSRRNRLAGNARMGKRGDPMCPGCWERGLATRDFCLHF
jgi:hypothetical protein